MAYDGKKIDHTESTAELNGLLNELVEVKNVPTLVNKDIFQDYTTKATQFDTVLLLAYLAGYDTEKQKGCLLERYTEYVNYLKKKDIFTTQIVPDINKEVSRASVITFLQQLTKLSANQIDYILPETSKNMTRRELYLSILQITMHPLTASRILISEKNVPLSRPKEITILVTDKKQAVMDAAFASWYLPENITFYTADSSKDEILMGLYEDFVDQYAQAASYSYNKTVMMTGQQGEMNSRAIPSLTIEKSGSSWQKTAQMCNQYAKEYRDGELSVYDYIEKRYKCVIKNVVTPISFSLAMTYDESWISLVAALPNIVVYEDEDYEEKLQSFSKQFLKDNASDIQNLKTINKYLCDYLKYCYEAQKNPSSSPAIHIWGAMTNQEVICTGYAKMFKWLMNTMGYDCVEVYGEMEPDIYHSWNKVKIGGKWFNVDVCWNDTSEQIEKYLLKTDKEVKSFGLTAKTYTNVEYEAK